MQVTKVITNNIDLILVLTGPRYIKVPINIYLSDLFIIDAFM